MIVVSVVLGFLVLPFVLPADVSAQYTPSERDPNSYTTTPAANGASQYGDPALVAPGSAASQYVQPSPAQGPVVQPATSVGIKNPLKGINSIQGFISEVLKFVVNLLAVAGVLYIIWTGFLFVKAQGNPAELETAKKSFFNAIIGMAIILGAWAIATVIVNTINKITNNNSTALKL